MVFSTKVKKRQIKERACLVTVQLKDEDRWRVEESLSELVRLVEAAGAEASASVIAVREKPTPALYVGKGKAEEIKKIVQEDSLSMVVFDNDLFPVQERNLQELLGVKVLDRTELILDIFAQRAVTNEGKLQIELAQLNYMLPRLTGLWTHFSRQVGGIGTRGPGEKQLEMDRRRVREKIFRLRKDLEKIRKSRELQRRSRLRQGFPLVSLVGYTNAGKSTLFNRLTSSSAYVKDQLFSTLSPLSRKLDLPNNQHAIISDTVGFLNKLPHHLVEAFKATLEEVVAADLLIHVVDVTAADMALKHSSVMEVLTELGAAEKPMITAVNKIDLAKSSLAAARAFREYPDSVAVSAKTGEGIEKLLERLLRQIGKEREFCRFLIPHEKAGVLDRIFKSGYICEKDWRPEGIYISAEVPQETKSALKEFLVG